jgi:hypothetical protein
MTNRVIAQTRLGYAERYIVSTVRTPLKDTYETCVFDDRTNKSEVVRSGMKYRSEALDSHIEWVREVFEHGYIFEGDRP